MRAAADVTALIGNTPLLHLRAVSEQTGCTILGKAEFLNPGGSVKDRTALGILRAARLRGIEVLPCFADIFARGGPRTTLGNFRFRRELKRCIVMNLSFWWEGACTTVSTYVAGTIASRFFGTPENTIIGVTDST